MKRPPPSTPDPKKDPPPGAPAAARTIGTAALSRARKRLFGKWSSLTRKQKLITVSITALGLLASSFLMAPKGFLFSMDGAGGDASFALAPSQPEFFHDQFVEYRLTAADPGVRKALGQQKLEMWVVRTDGGVAASTVPIPTVGKVTRVAFKAPEGDQDHFTARWPVPWNFPDGEYAVRVDTSSFSPEWPALSYKNFKVVSRAFDEVPAGWGILTLEDLNGLNNLPAPDGTRKDATALADWADFIGANAVVIQGAESGGYSKKLPADKPWFTQSDKSIRLLGNACRERGLKLGVYLLTFMVGGPPQYSPDYKYGVEYRDGKLVSGLEMKTRRGISITDPKRVDDVVKMLKHWHDMPEVDIVGLDYIRPVFGGMELADDFAREMPVDLPPGFWKRSAHDRMMWLAHSRRLLPTLHMEELKNFSFIDRWFWYRCHRTAQIVRAIKGGLNPTKPLWAFTLSWEKGWQHGQDPVMMRDAGIDIDSIMLYEADGVQFKALVRQWNEYVKRSQVNLTVGDVIDWPLHQKTLDPAGPEDYYNRNMMAVTGFHTDGPVRGLFVHDYNRARKGRLGPYSTKEWMLAAGACITAVRDVNDKLPYKLKLSVPAAIHSSAAAPVVVSLEGKGTVKARLYGAADVELSRETIELSPENPSVTLSARFRPGANSAARGHRSFIAVRTEPEDPRERCQIQMKYFQGK